MDYQIVEVLMTFSDLHGMHLIKAF